MGVQPPQSAATAAPIRTSFEARGIEPVPLRDRRGSPRDLFSVWFSSNFAYLYILLGSSLMMSGLTVPQALFVLVAGNLFWPLVGLLAISGPVTGTTSSVVMRAFFGTRGNRLIGSGLGWLTAVGYEAVNLSIITLTALALLKQIDVAATPLVTVTVVMLSAGVTFGISLYGHALIIRLSKAITAGLGACMLLASCFIAYSASTAPLYDRPAPTSTLPTLLIGFTVIASGPLSWLTSADYSRYLPPGTSRGAVAGWTAAGGFLAAVLLGLIGILAGSAVDMSDPQASMKGLMPGWFYPVFLLTVVIGTLANNILTCYSSGLMLQGAGVRVKRATTVCIDAVLGVAIALYALFSGDFMAAINNILALSVTYLGPIIAIYAMDIVLRRNRYDALNLGMNDGAVSAGRLPTFGWHGAIAFLSGTGAALLSVNTAMWVGPVSRALGGADLAAVAGPLLAATVYAVLRRARRSVT
ncbi:purine-cytosine permease family protein [[Actinomadura] parvosata]|uniref:purine-cytosine permease family protein n=1 Tax=[Actinomadura] parvosata TaxID=1955412 RepID=UPI00406C724E